MAIKEIKQYPHEALLKICVNIKEDMDVTWIKSIIQDLTDTMIQYEGVGLAAPQIDIPYRIIVFKNEENKIVHLINPIIISSSNMVKSIDEGCLSTVHRRNIRRYKNIIVKGYILENDEFKEVTIKPRKKHLSFRIQHEIDHLNGITILHK